MPALAAEPKPDPIVWLVGGPGDDAVGEAKMAVDGGLNRDRDVIFMSQRGTYSATPRLTCPDIDKFNARAVGLVYDAPSTERLHVEATKACHDRLAARGTDLSAYNDTESAADYADLRAALRIKQWNLYGISYGTDLALIYMRLHPEGLRSVGIDGILPPSKAGSAATWSSARQGFDGLFKACADQPACNRRYPNLPATFDRLVRELEAKPVTTTVTVPGRAKPVKVVLDGGALVNWMTSATHVAPQVPLALDELAHGKPQRIAQQWAGWQAQPPGRRKGCPRTLLRRLLQRVDAVREPGGGAPGRAGSVPVVPPLGTGPGPTAHVPAPGLRHLEHPRGAALDPGRHAQRHSHARHLGRVRLPDRCGQRAVRRPHAEQGQGRHRPLRTPRGVRHVEVRAEDHRLVLRHPDRPEHRMPQRPQATPVRDRPLKAEVRCSAVMVGARSPRRRGVRAAGGRR